MSPTELTGHALHFMPVFVLPMVQLLGKHEKPYDGMLTSYQSDDLDCTRYMAVTSNQSQNNWRSAEGLANLKAIQAKSRSLKRSAWEVDRQHRDGVDGPGLGKKQCFMAALWPPPTKFVHLARLLPLSLVQSNFLVAVHHLVATPLVTPSTA